MGRLYHYTSEQGHKNIVTSGVIRQSQNFTRDCVYGNGVYLTTLNPEDFSKADLAKNNYGGGWRKRLSDGRLDYYIEIEIPFSDLKLEKCKTSDTDRDVYLYSGDLDLTRFQWQSGENTSWSYSEVLGAVAVGVAAVGVTAVVGKMIWDYFSSNKEKKKDDESKLSLNKTNKY